MKRLLSAFLPLAIAFALQTASGVERPGSPFDLALGLEARMAAGDGVTLPTVGVQLARFAGTVDLSRGTWPEPFKERAGETVCVAVSPFTGYYEFSDTQGEVFWTVVPVFPTTENWVAPFRHAEPGPASDDDLYAPWRLVDTWFLSHAEFAESVESGSHAENAENAERVASRPRLREAAEPDAAVSNLCFTAFSFDATNLFFAAAWPTNEALPENVVDLYGKSNLLSRAWTFLSSHPATNPPVSFSIGFADLPWHVTPTQHVHGAACVSVTNVVVSPLDGLAVYTNVFWSCSTNRVPADAGFFRLGTHFDGDGDGLFDALELLVYGTSTNAFDTDGDGAPDGADPTVWALTHPMWATNAETADLIVDLIAPQNAGATVSVGNLSRSLDMAPLMFSLPPGHVVSCFVDFSSQFLILWCGTSGGSFFGTPESFEKPIWTSGMESFAGRHESADWCEIAVPVLTAEPSFAEPLRSGQFLTNGNHLTSDGSICIHAVDGIQQFPWTIQPAVVAAGRTPFTTGAVRLAGSVPYIDVTGTSGTLSGTFGFSPGAPTGATGTLWGGLSVSVSAHYCDATYQSPVCSCCGEYCYQYGSDHDIDYLTVVPEENEYYHLIREIVRFPGSQQRVFREWKNPDPDLHQPVFYCDAQSLLQEPPVFADPMAYMETEAHMTPDETPEPEDCSWRCIAGLPDPIPELESGVWADFHVPLHGGVFKFRFSCEGISDSDAFLVLPLAGASVDSVVSSEIANADAFAAAVLRTHQSWFERNDPRNGLKWFVNNGAGDCLGRPDSQLSPTVWFYNQVSDETGFGAICTWNGKCVRLAKISNFLVAYACQKIGVTALNQDISQRIGSSNDMAAMVSWDCGVDLANGTKTLSECARWIGDASKGNGDEKLEKLWPNPALADNFAEPDSIFDYDTQFTIPGFLRMEDP